MVTPQVVLKLAIETMNNTMRPEDVVPLSLIFVVITSLPINPKSLPNQKDQSAALHWLWKEYICQL